MIAVLASLLFAQEVPNRPDSTIRPLTAPHFTVRRAPGPIVVDGSLDDAGWAGADDIAIDWEVAPGNNSRPEARAVCHVTYNQANLYLGCRAFDPRPGEVRAHLTDRDDVSGLVLDDLIGAYIDPFADQRRAFIFLTNARGVQADGIRNESGQGEDYSWDATWKSAGRVTNTGFTVEIAIPFKSLRFPRSTHPEKWGILFVRSRPRSVRIRSQSAPNDRGATCYLCQANTIAGFEGISPGHNIELAPTLTSQRTDARPAFPAGPLVSGNTRFDFGADLHWGITSNLSLNATANPDFSQVEADVALLDVNTRYALYYPEKRPFFLEGGDFFNTPIQAVFTRTVADPDAGLKLTGKIGNSSKNVIGIFGARDQITNLLIPSNQGTTALTLDQPAWTTASRFRRDLGANSNLGFLYTGRFGADYFNQVGGGDFLMQLGRSNRLTVQYLGSLTEYPDSTARANAQPGGSFRGGALTASLNHLTEHWQVAAQYTDLSPNFRADVGFIPRVDTRNITVFASPIFRRATGWFTDLSFGPSFSQTRQHDGTLTDQDATVALNYGGPLQTQAYLQAMAHQERYLNQLYRFGRTTGYFQTTPLRGFSVGATWQLGGAIDYVNARQAHEVTVSPYATLAASNGLTLNVSDSHQRLTTGAAEIFSANILQGKLNYNFSVHTAIRAIVQYRTVRRNLTLFTDPADENEQGILGQFLFSYRVSPQTALYVGYADNGTGTESYALTRMSRTFFAKLGYAWRP